MEKYSCAFVILHTLFQLGRSQPDGFVVTAPSIFGAEETVCISFKNSIASNVTAVLLEHKSENEIASNDRIINGSSGCLVLKRGARPADAPSLARLVVSIQDDTIGAATVISARTVKLITDSWLTFISTEKPTYGPNDVVRFRIFSVSPTLRPLLQEMEAVWIENPHGIRVHQWLNVNPVRGIAELSLSLVAEPVLGTWLIKASRNSHIESRAFTVQKEELPTFKISLSLPVEIESNNSFPITVCARYTFGKPVQGSVSIEMGVECIFKYYCSNSTDSHHLNLTLGSDGCVKSDVIADPTDTPALQYVVVKATVVEAGTNVSRHEAAKARLLPPGSENKLRAVFQLFTPQIKPALPFYGKLKLLQKNETFGGNVSIDLCYREEDEKWCTNINTGNADVLFSIPPNPGVSNPQRLAVEASWSGENIRSGQKQMFLRPWYSPSSSYLQIQTNHIQSSFQCGEEISINVLHNLPEDENTKFYALITARNSVIYFNEVTHLSTYKASVIPVDTLKVVSLGPWPLVDVRSFGFTINVTSDLMPSASVLVYSVRGDEVVADSFTFSIQKCFDTLDATWDATVKAPGSDVHLKIKSRSKSVCAVSAANNKFPVTSVADSIYQQLIAKYKTADSEPFKDKCFNDTEALEEDATNLLTVSREMSSVFVDSLYAFETSGLVVMSDLQLLSRPCRPPVHVQPKTLPIDVGFVEGDLEWESEELNTIPSEEPIISTRSNFNDNWLWEIVHLGEDGLSEVKAVLPHSVTDWITQVTCLSEAAGLVEAEPMTLRSFQPFFLDYTVPPAVVRHEVLHLPVSVFNYMTQSVPVMLEIPPSEYFYVQSDLTQSLCVPPNGKLVHVFHIIAVKLGASNISIRAHTDPHANAECGPVLHHYKVDLVMKPITIKARGQVIEEVRSSLICGKEMQKKAIAQPDKVEWSMKIASSDYVQQTVSSEARVSGDVFGPALMNAPSFITKPMGFGEQIMGSFVANLLVVKYLLARYSVTSVGGHVTKALKNLEQAYQQQLSYRHSDGSYSVFGPDSDSESSIRLTAAVVRFFSDAKLLLHIDEAALNQTVKLMISQQLENGGFRVAEFFRFSKNQKTEVSSKVVSAEVLISLLKSGLPVTHQSIKNGLLWIQAAHDDDLYGEMLTTYVLALAGELREASGRMRVLLRAATHTYHSLYWKQENHRLDLVLTSYGVLTLLKLGGSHFLGLAADSVRAILLSLNSNGYFPTPQETIAGLEAIAEYSESLPRGDAHLNISLDFATGNQSFEISESNRYVQQTATLPPFLTTLQFSAQGSGCALVQTVIKYNIRKGSSSKSIKVQLHVDSVGFGSDVRSRQLQDPADVRDKSLLRIEACMRALPEASLSGIVVVEFNLPTGYAADRTSLYQLTTSHKGVRKFEEFDDHVNLYLHELTEKMACVHFLIRQNYCVANVSTVFMKVYDAENPIRHQASMRYKIDQFCNDTEIVDNSLRTNILELGSHDRRRRDATSSERFATFSDSSFDLEVPNQISGTFKIFALPPPTNKNQNKCPLCMKAATDEFPKLYCSSQLSAKVKLRGRDLLEVLQDLSPHKNTTSVRRMVSFTMKKRCVCDFVEYGEIILFMLVTPPRTFNLDSIQVVHLDESISLFPWSTTEKYLSTVRSPNHCTDILTQE